jgi:predicted Zn-dependent protease
MTKALDYLLKGETCLHYFRKDANAEGQRLYKEAINADANFARPYAYQAFAVLQAYLYNWYAGTDAIKDMTYYADQALVVDPNDYQNHWIRAAVYLYSRDFTNAKKKYADVALMAAKDAIPEELRAFKVDNADMLLLTGNPKQAIADVNDALKTGIPERWFYWVLGWAYYVDGQYNESLTAFSNFRFARNAIRKNVIANLVALNKVADAKKEAALFLLEEKADGCTYAVAGQPVLPGLLAIEDRVPFESQAQRDIWKGHLQQAFDWLNQP